MPCDIDGYNLEPGARLEPQPPQDPTDYFPFTSQADFYDIFLKVEGLNSGRETTRRV